MHTNRPKKEDVEITKFHIYIYINQHVHFSFLSFCFFESDCCNNNNNNKIVVNICDKLWAAPYISEWIYVHDFSSWPLSLCECLYVTCTYLFYKLQNLWNSSKYVFLSSVHVLGLRVMALLEINAPRAHARTPYISAHRKSCMNSIRSAWRLHMWPIFCMVQHRCCRCVVHFLCVHDIDSICSALHSALEHAMQNLFAIIGNTQTSPSFFFSYSGTRIHSFLQHCSAVSLWF